MASHHLDDKSAVVTGCSGGDCIHSFCDPVQGCVSTDGHVGPKHVVVDGADQANHCQLWVSTCFLLGDRTFLN